MRLAGQLNVPAKSNPQLHNGLREVCRNGCTLRTNPIGNVLKKLSLFCNCIFDMSMLAFNFADKINGFNLSTIVLISGYRRSEAPISLSEGSPLGIGRKNPSGPNLFRNPETEHKHGLPPIMQTPRLWSLPKSSSKGLLTCSRAWLIPYLEQ